MHCPHCGKELSAAPEFCPYCGEKMHDSTPKPAVLSRPEPTEPSQVQFAQYANRPRVPYSSLSGLCKAIVILMSIYLVLNVGYIPAALYQNACMETSAYGDELHPSDLAIFGTACGGVIFLLAGGIVFLVWNYKSYRNLNALGLPQKYSPGWAVGAWFVPFLNLIRPYQMIKEMADHPSPGSSLVGIWWTFHILAGVIGQFSMRMPADTTQQAITSNWVGIADSCLALVSGLLFLKIVRDVTLWQEARIAQLISQSSLEQVPTAV